jgi:TonB family protein
MRTVAGVCVFVALAAFVVRGDDQSNPASSAMATTDHCSTRDTAAAVANLVKPSIALPNRRPTRVQVLVDVSERGFITGLSISKSSGNTSVDDAVLSAAASSTYLPACKDGRQVFSVFTYSAEVALPVLRGPKR